MTNELLDGAGASEAVDEQLLDAGGLDPESWDDVRRLGHRMVDDLVSWWQTQRQRPAWQPMPLATRERLAASLPEQPTPREAVYEEFRRDILPYPTGNAHPRFFSHVIGTGTPLGAFAELLASGMNCNLFGGEQAACHVERQVVGWLASLLGLPASAGGLLLSGGSMANIVALAIALRARAGFDIRREGLASAPRRPRLYCSSETHNCLDKGADLLGLGSDAVRRIPADDVLPSRRLAPRAGDRRGPCGRLAALLRRRQRRHGGHGRHRPARRAGGRL